MQMLPRPIVVLLALVALAVVAGCGDDSGLSKQELIAKGDKLCTDARRNTPTAPTGGGLAVFARYFDQVDKGSSATLAKFKKLEPRDSERKQFEAFLAAAEQRVKSIRKARDAARAGNVAGVQAALRTETRRQPEYRRIARQIGFKVCGSGGG